ncbi:MAG: HupE/UreJ family protein [Xanthomonadales bacterium]|nr:HupE/UreJ family protein [Gammaproteobacteria bacterium]NNE06404.1 HupE/UreJ family protein [Xanthomonadales bacterium]NNL95165.1 HupE/UreJ family protein [Xanthomonadales bacterium]
MDPALCRELARLDSVEPITASGGQDLPRVELDRPWHEVAGLYLHLGYVHILPRGLDHILFVLALFLASTRFRALLLQVSVFTLAHTLTLGLAAAGKISATPGIVEPLIAASIAFVAVENIFLKDISRWRPLVVFGFGLFHGLGFAGVLQGLGLPEGQFLAALVSFNIGVELGQLSVIVAAWVLLFKYFGQEWYRPRIVIPASAAIALTGLWWAVQRAWPLFA